MHIIVHYPHGSSISDEQKRRADELMQGAVQAEKPKPALIQVDMIGTERRNEDDGIRCIVFGLDSDPVSASMLMKKIGRALADVFRRHIVVRDGASGSSTIPVEIKDRRREPAAA